MKKGTKIWLIVALIFALTGAGLCIAAVSKGVTPRVLRQNIADGHYSISAEDFWKDEPVDVSQSFPAAEDMEHLSVSMDFGSLTIKETPDDRQEIYLEAGEDADAFELYVDDYEIWIENTDRLTWAVHMDMPKATLYLPKDMRFRLVDIDVDAGECRIEVPITCDKLEVDVDAGGADIQNISAEYAEVDCDAGGVLLSGTVEGGGSADVDAGKIQIDLKGKEATDYNYEIEVSAGSLNINDHSYSGLEKKRYIDNDAASDWRLICDAGKLEMNIQK